MAKCQNKYCDNEGHWTLKGYCRECWWDEHVDDPHSDNPDEELKRLWEDRTVL